MKSVHALLVAYGESHQNPINKFIHWVCVPLIILSLLGLLWSIPFPVGDSSIPLLNWATLLLLIVIFYYLLLSWQLAAGMIVFSCTLYLILFWLDDLAIPLWVLSLVVFTVAWIGQFIGHYIEGKRPSFFKDVQFLLIGPLWLLATIYRKLKLPY